MLEFINPLDILSQIEIKKDALAADFGSGSGSWALPLAKKLEEGTVFAIDVQEEPLSALQGKAKLHNISNIKRVVANVESKIPDLQDSFLDWVLMTNLLFQVDNKQAVFEEAKRVLKPGGKILIVEWKTDSLLGPKQGKVSPQEVKGLAERLNFVLKKSFKAGDYHFALLFEKG